MLGVSVIHGPDVRAEEFNVLLWAATIAGRTESQQAGRKAVVTRPVTPHYLVIALSLASATISYHT